MISHVMRYGEPYIASSAHILERCGQAPKETFDEGQANSTGKTDTVSRISNH